jgi:D-alanyl-D-alanine dipeptidase
VLQNRKLLQETMAAEGFQSIRTEWWHYYYRGEKKNLSDFVWKCAK